MSRYYQDSIIFKWLRRSVFKIEKPTALPWGGWKIWDNETKTARPVAYFMTETLPEWCEWIPNHTIDYVDNLRYYISNRIYKSHCLNSTLKKGKYHEFSSRILYSLFDSYVDFIEIEEAHMHIDFSKKEDREKYNVPGWYRFYFLRWFGKRRFPEAGISHLKWEMTLDRPNPSDPNWQLSPFQASSAREKMTLYSWWKHIRPTRGGSWEKSGLSEFWEKMDTKYEKREWLGFGGASLLTAAEKRTYNKLQEIKGDLEKQWDDEDEEMMIRLIRIRENLWT